MSKKITLFIFRKNERTLNMLGAGLMATMTGKPAVVPLTHGQKFAAKKLKPITVVDTTPSVRSFQQKVIMMLRASGTQLVHRKYIELINY